MYTISILPRMLFLLFYKSLAYKICLINLQHTRSIILTTQILITLLLMTFAQLCNDTHNPMEWIYMLYTDSHPVSSTYR